MERLAEMEAEKLRKTLKKVHPDKALVEQVKQYRKSPVRLWRYATVCACVGLLFLAAGIWTAGKLGTTSDEPHSVQWGDEISPMELSGQESRSQEPVLYVREAMTAEYYGKTVILLDECTPEYKRQVLEEPIEGMICYTEDIPALMAEYSELLPEMVFQEEKMTVLVFRQGEWHWEQMNGE